MIVSVCVSTALWNVSGGAHRPLDDQHVRQISSLWKELLEFIEWDGGLVAELFSQNCITRLQEMSIKPLQERARNELFLHILTRKSISEYKKFMTCLLSTGQDYVVALIEGNAGLSTKMSSFSYL